MAQEVSQELQRWIEWDRKEKQQKLERFRRLNRYARKGQIVFAGSSLMEQFSIYEFLQDFVRCCFRICRVDAPVSFLKTRQK